MLEYAASWGISAANRPNAYEGDELWALMWENPPLFPPGRMLWNLPAWHRAELPGSNAIGTVRSLARLYGLLACEGALDGIRLLDPETVALARTPLGRGPDPFPGTQMTFGVGFALNGQLRGMGPPPAAFGAGGAGGSIHCAWPQERVGLSYATNELRDDPAGDARAAALLDALHACVR